MKTIIHKLSALGLALLVLFSTFSFTVDFHYCGDHLMDVAFMEPTEACSMNSDMPVPTDDCMIGGTCCSDLALVQDAPEVINLGGPDLQFLQSVEMLVVFYQIPQLVLDEQESAHDRIQRYKPPGRAADLQLLFQTFLI